MGGLLHLLLLLAVGAASGGWAGAVTHVQKRSSSAVAGTNAEERILECPDETGYQRSVMSTQAVHSWAIARQLKPAHAAVFLEHQLDASVLSEVSYQDLTALTKLPLGLSVRVKRCFPQSLLGHVVHAGTSGSAADSLPTGSLLSTPAGLATRQLAEGQPCAIDAVDRVGLACCPDDGPAACVDSLEDTQPGFCSMMAASCATMFAADAPPSDYVGGCDLTCGYCSGGHRLLQDGSACDTLPQSCSEACAQAFVPFFETCSSEFATPEFDQLNEQCLTVLNGGGGGGQSCTDSTTWISDYERVGCAQYAPGLMSWQSMCEVGRGQLR